MTSSNTLIVTVESLADVEARTRDAFDKALSGDVPDEDAPHRLSFGDTDEMAVVFSPRAIDLLRTVAREEPASMREAARMVDRDIKDVSRNLDQLAEYGVVEFVEEGRAKRPVVPFDDIEIRLPLRAGADDAEHVEA
ncbi:HVO_A0114 family putative DNA-binding protein [Candidatus Halobonum tyrrellensis]|uniref:HVO_A0114 family putative DNA-binding protein n=1 Tax=Candidatus Halobonum tyrrellensis TaxID=1431545 RepID=UPI0006779D4F|nr:transcriptional regulator [Candidatus Halobonum tyrrellensis]